MPIVALIMERQNNFTRLENRASLLFASWQVRVDQGNRWLNSKLGILSDDCEQILFLAVVQRLKYAVVIGEAGKLLFEMPSQKRHVECHTKQRCVTRRQALRQNGSDIYTVE